MRLSLLSSVLPVIFAGALVGCGDSSDESQGPSTEQDAATDSPAPPDAGLEAETGSDATAEASEEASAEAGVKRFAILVGSDYATTAQAAVIDLETSTLAGRVTFDDQDTLPYASGGRGFLLHRTQGKVSVLDAVNPATVERTLDVGVEADAGKANPYAVVVSAGTEAYVLRYGQNTAPVIDLGTGAQTASIDLTSFVADNDGLVDVVDGAYDAASARVYLVLQRIDQTELGEAPDYVGKCSGIPALVVGIDAATRSVIDLNGAKDGTAIALEAVNPWSVAWDETSRTLMVLGVGCVPQDADAGMVRAGRGIERVMVDSGATSWWWKTEQTDRPGAMVWMPGQGALVGTDDASFARHWRKLETSATEPGPDLTGVPNQPAYDGDGGLIGLEAQTDGGTGWDAVRWDPGTSSTTVIASGVFDKPGLMAYGSATIR